MDPLLTISLTLAAIHFGIPLGYYSYARSRWLPRPWQLKIDQNHRPRVTVILPTYNESELIRSRLDNLATQDYPRAKMEIIVVDSGSQDGTAEVVESWIKAGSGIETRIMREPKRTGKFPALTLAVSQVNPSSEVVIFTDADALWESDAVSSVANYFADPSVGAVTTNITYTSDPRSLNEIKYRGYYNILRLAESKQHSTPVQNGPLLALRASLLWELGLPNFPGSDDCAFGSFVAFAGYRAIQINDTLVREPMRGSQIHRKIRRAQHVLLNFLCTKRYAMKTGIYVPSPFDMIWKIEWFLWVVNPWLLVACIVFILAVATQAPIIALFLLGCGTLLLGVKGWRMWISQQLYLAIAALRNLWTKDLTWSR